EIPETAGDVPLRRKGPIYPRIRHREDPCGRSERHLSCLPGGSRVQLRRARRIRSGQRAARTRTHAPVSGRAIGEEMIKLADSNLWKSRGYVAGEWLAADSGKTTEIRNPATAEILGSVPFMGAAETRRAIEAANAALPAWAKKTAGERAKIL